MASLVYDAEGNIVQTIASSSTGFNQATVNQPLTNAAVNGNVSPIAAPNAFSTTSDRGAGVKTSAFSVNNVVGGTVISVVTNPA